MESSGDEGGDGFSRGDCSSSGEAMLSRPQPDVVVAGFTSGDGRTGAVGDGSEAKRQGRQ